MKLLKFEKEHCSSCQKVDAYLSQYDQFDVTRVNPFEQPKTAVKYEISSVPVTILLDEEGNEVKRTIGFKPVELKEIVGLLF